MSRLDKSRLRLKNTVARNKRTGRVNPTRRWSRKDQHVENAGAVRERLEKPMKELAQDANSVTAEPVAATEVKNESQSQVQQPLRRGKTQFSPQPTEHVGEIPQTQEEENPTSEVQYDYLYLAKGVVIEKSGGALRVRLANGRIFSVVNVGGVHVDVGDVVEFSFSKSNPTGKFIRVLSQNRNHVDEKNSPFQQNHNWIKRRN